MTEFVTLSPALEGWFDKPFNELPDDLRRRIKDLLHAPWSSGMDRSTAAVIATPWNGDRSVTSAGADPRLVSMHWDNLTPNQRRMWAEQWDWTNDPALEDKRQHSWNLTMQRFEMEASDPRGDPSKIELKRLRLAEIDAELAKIDAEFAISASASADTTLCPASITSDEEFVGQFIAGQQCPSITALGLAIKSTGRGGRREKIREIYRRRMLERGTPVKRGPPRK